MFVSIQIKEKFEPQLQQQYLIIREFRIKLRTKTDIAHIAKRCVQYRFSSAI